MYCLQASLGANHLFWPASHRQATCNDLPCTMTTANFHHAPGFGISLHAVQRPILPSNPGQPVQHCDVHLDVPNPAQAQQQSEGGDECGPADPCGAGQVGHGLVGLNHPLDTLTNPSRGCCRWVRAMPSHRLVPGDVVVLQQGRAVGDMVLLRGACLVAESMLSGEVQNLPLIVTSVWTV